MTLSNLLRTSAVSIAMNFLRVSHSLTHLRRSTRTFASTTTRAVGTSDLYKKDLIANIAETYELSHTQSGKIINTIFDSIVEVRTIGASCPFWNGTGWFIR